jgi:hypothetical protein
MVPSGAPERTRFHPYDVLVPVVGCETWAALLGVVAERHAVRDGGGLVFIGVSEPGVEVPQTGSLIIPRQAG